MLHPEALAQNRLKKLVGLHALGYRRLLAGAAAVHFLNPVERDRAVGLPRPRRSAVIPNGVFAEDYAGLPPPGASGRRGPYVLFLARVHAQKGVDLLADAFAQVARSRPDVELVVAGPDQGALPDLLARVEKHGIRDRVHVVGPVYGREKQALVRDAAVYCLPSRQEGFSVAITEALATGTPCVVTETCNFPEVATAGCGAVTALDAGAIARGLLDVLRDPAEARAMGARGRALVLERYTWPRIAAEMVALYREVRRR
jgi:glycosyltransferase involved in cell wall biosynthesis